MDLGKLKGKEVVDGHDEVAGRDQRQVVVREMDQRHVGAEQGERQDGLLRQAIGLRIDRHQVGRSADQRPNKRGILAVGEDRESIAQKLRQLRKQPANIATNAKRPDQARVEADPPDGQTTLMVSDP